MERICNVCRFPVKIPDKVKKTDKSKKKGDVINAVCPRCKASAPLKVRRRNGNVKGLKQGFAKKGFAEQKLSMLHA